MKSAGRGGRGQSTECCTAGTPWVLGTGGAHRIWASEKVPLLSDSVTFLVDLSSMFAAKFLFPEHSRNSYGIPTPGWVREVRQRKDSRSF